MTIGSTSRGAECANLPTNLKEVRQARNFSAFFRWQGKNPMLTAALQTESGATDAVFHQSGRIAQLVEQLTLNQRVLGSSPSASTTFSR